MKRQYFGDVNDYLTYGVLRCVLRAGGFKLLVVWMLTDDEPKGSGQRRQYLAQPEKWQVFDPELFQALRDMTARATEEGLTLFEHSGLLGKTRFFSLPVPVDVGARKVWFQRLQAAAHGSDMVFLDPDNGLEIPSVPWGRRGFERYLFWHEVEALWSQGLSLVVFQYLPRKPRISYLQSRLSALGEHTPGSQVAAVFGSFVSFLFAWQPPHAQKWPQVAEELRKRWQPVLQLVSPSRQC